MALSPVTEQFISIDAIKQGGSWRLLRDDERRFLLSAGLEVAGIEVETGRDGKSLSSRCWAQIESRIQSRDAPTPEGIVRIINSDALNDYCCGIGGLFSDPRFSPEYGAEDGQKEECCGFEFVAAKIPGTGEFFWTFDTRQLDKLLAAGINYTLKDYHFRILGFHPALDEATEIAIDDFSGCNNLTGNHDVHALIEQFMNGRSGGFSKFGEIECVPRGHVFELQIRSELVDRDIKVFMREANILCEFEEHKSNTYVYAMSRADFDAMVADIEEYHKLSIPDYRNEKLLSLRSLSEVLPDLLNKTVKGIIDKIHKQLDDMDFHNRTLSDCKRPFTVKVPTDNWRLFDYHDFAEAQNDNFERMGNNPLYPPYIELKLRVVRMPSSRVGDLRYQDSEDPLMQIVLAEDPAELKTKLSLLKPYELIDISERKASLNKPVVTNPEISPEIPAISDYKEGFLVTINQDKAIELLAILKGSDSALFKRFLALAYNQDESIKPEIQQLFGLDQLGRQISCAGLEYSDSTRIRSHWSTLSETNQPRGYRFRIGGKVSESNYVCITGNGFHRVVKVDGSYFEVLLPSPSSDSEVTITPIKGLKRGRAITMQVKAYRNEAREKEIATLIADTIYNQASLPKSEKEKNLLLAIMKKMPDASDWEHIELERSDPASESTVWITDPYSLDGYVYALSECLETTLDNFNSKRPRPGDLYNEYGLIYIVRRHPKTKETLMTFDTRQLQKYITAGDNQTDECTCHGILGIHPDFDQQTEILLSNGIHENLQGNEIIHSMLISQIIVHERKEFFNWIAEIPKGHVFRLHIEWRGIDRQIEVFLREAAINHKKIYVYAMDRAEYDLLEAEVSRHAIRPIPVYDGELFVAAKDLYKYWPLASQRTVSYAVEKIRKELKNICCFIGYLKHFDEPFTVSIPTDYWQLVYPSFEEAKQDNFRKNDGYPSEVKLKFKFVINNSERQEKKFRCAQKESMQIVFAETPDSLAHKLNILFPPSATCDLPPATDDSGIPVELQVSTLGFQDPAGYFDNLPKKTITEKKNEASMGVFSMNYDGEVEIKLGNNQRIPLLVRTVTANGILVIVPSARTKDLQKIAEIPGELAERIKLLIPAPKKVKPARKRKEAKA